MAVAATLLQRLVYVFRAGGVRGVVRAAVRRIRTPRARCFELCRNACREAIGIEIGGPTALFARGGLLPIYPIAQRIDNCNFAAQTLWETTDSERFVFDESRAPGRQIVAEATSMPMLETRTYQFVLSAHTIEHTANPLGALAEWRRLLIDGGTLVLVVPHRDGTFDHRRPVTTLAHLLADRDAHRDEHDQTHWPEVLAYHDHARDPGVRKLPFAERVARNSELRSIHHHVFDAALVVQMVTAAGFRIRAVEVLRPYHIIVVAERAEPPTTVDDVDWSEIRRRSPFPTDRCQ